jgi:hypothetical protein
MRLCALALVCVLIGLSGCQSAEPNLLRNGSFEQGVEPWFSLESEHWAGFSRSDRYAVDGRFSAYLALRADPEDHGAKVFGLIQELRPKRFPKRLSGYYRVENWRRGIAKQYLQFVVIVWGDRAVSQYSNVQIRYILAGLTSRRLRSAMRALSSWGIVSPLRGAGCASSAICAQIFCSSGGISQRTLRRFECSVKPATTTKSRAQWCLLMSITMRCIWEINLAQIELYAVLLGVPEGTEAHQSVGQ